LRARPALGVSVGEQQSHYCDTEQNKTDRAHGSSPSPSFRGANLKGGSAFADKSDELAVSLPVLPVLPAERIAHVGPPGGAALRDFDSA
jgi:hypothetical protein